MSSVSMIPSGYLPASGAESRESLEWFGLRLVLLRLRPLKQQQGKIMEGHNSNAQLKAIVERIESVETDIKGQMDDRKEIYLEAKSNGYDVPALKAIIARRRKDQKKLADLEAMVDTYEAALG